MAGFVGNNDRTVPLELLQVLSEQIGGEWRDIGRILNISEAQLDHIKVDYTGRLKETIYQMLLHWKRQKGTNATHGVLVEALKAAKRVDLAEYVTKSKVQVPAQPYINNGQVDLLRLLQDSYVITYSPSTTHAQSEPTSCKRRDGCLHQFPIEVTNFSSQYGQEQSNAYVASNLAGSCSLFPKYLDSSQACVFRTYGPWWDIVPSATGPFSNRRKFLGTDFIDLKLETPVIPGKIRIFETYYPGCICQIFGAKISHDTLERSLDVRWYNLWEDENRSSAKDTRQEATTFEPEIRLIPEHINVIRLIISSKNSEYYTELDAVEVIEAKRDIADIDNELKLLSVHERRKQSTQSESLTSHPPVNYFEKLSEKLILLILSKLDFDDLCRTASTCTLLKKHCYNPLLFQELDLQPYWSTVTSGLLDSLRVTSRLSCLQKLSVSWCSYGNNIRFATALASVIREYGRHLQVLRIQGCSFNLDETLLQVAAGCKDLNELNLSSSRNVNNGYLCISLMHSLTRLDLYRALVTEERLTEIFKVNPHLQHLNIGNVITIKEFDRVALAIGNYCKDLISLNLWRANSLTSQGLNCISQNCINLEEIDLGWCNKINPESNCFVTLVQSCTRLKKVFLSGVKHTRDADVQAFATCCQNLELLDVMGGIFVHPSSINRLLHSSRRLVFLDVSYCRHISNQHCAQWKISYPHVNIKGGHIHMT
ncbi:F-box/LRR-repeat protein 4 [Holothuria leucospilota]|uniref:F-box/LRR-repeat protein 4 n=1 Tax=Holothuria leucospilota TaxID=206669 RepID=A0A9Q0YL73_HOLLE|nr:F-box/LRR-repeat protein 4 [Holothuria leucospilota]